MGKNKRGGGIVEIDSKFIVKYTQNEDSSKKNSYIFESQNEDGNAIDLLTQDNILSYNVINYYFLLFDYKTLITFIIQSIFDKYKHNFNKSEKYYEYMVSKLYDIFDVVNYDIILKLLIPFEKSITDINKIVNTIKNIVYTNTNNLSNKIHVPLFTLLWFMTEIVSTENSNIEDNFLFYFRWLNTRLFFYKYLNTLLQHPEYMKFISITCITDTSSIEVYKDITHIVFDEKLNIMTLSLLNSNQKTIDIKRITDLQINFPLSVKLAIETYDRDYVDDDKYYYLYNLRYNNYLFFTLI